MISTCIKISVQNWVTNFNNTKTNHTHCMMPSLYPTYKGPFRY